MDEGLVDDNRVYLNSRRLYYKWRIYELVSALFGCLGIFTSTVDYETGFSSKRNHYNCEENSTQYYRWVTLALTLVSAAVLVLRHRTKVKWYNTRPEEPNQTNKEAEIKRKQIKKKKNTFSKHLFLELVLIGVFPYPNLSSTFTIIQAKKESSSDSINPSVHLCYTVSELFYVFMFVRLAFLLRAIFNFTPYQDNIARYYCALHRTKANVRFSIRCMLQSKPFTMIVIFIVPSFFILGVFLRVFEKPYSDVSELNFDSYLNSVWCCAVTMATIGYGDLYPGTFPGRTIAVLCGMWGAFAFSMIVFSLESVLHLTQNQNKAFNAIIRSRAAAKAIRACLYYNLLKNLHGRRSAVALNQMKSVRKKAANFVNTVKKLNSASNTYTPVDKSKERFKKLSLHMRRIEEKLDRVLGDD